MRCPGQEGKAPLGVSVTVTGTGVRVGQTVPMPHDVDPEEQCACPEQHPTVDGRCANPSLRSEDPERLPNYSECGCCVADCPDVGHPEPRPSRIMPGTLELSEELVESQPPENQRLIRERDVHGELRIVSRAERARRFGRET